MDGRSTKRTVMLIASAADIFIGALGLLSYFGLLPFDLDGFGIPRWAAGLIGGVLFFSGVAVFAYSLSAPDSTE